MPKLNGRIALAFFGRENVPAERKDIGTEQEEDYENDVFSSVISEHIKMKKMDKITFSILL